MTPGDIDDPARRRFLQLMGASLALTGGACSGPPPEHIVPYVDLPPELRDSAPVFYATAFVTGGYAQGVLVETNMGRATKVEGNAAHPASLGATGVHAQASALQLWDPERSQAVYSGQRLATWSEYDGALDQRLLQLQRSGGAGLRILTGAVTSPTLLAQLRALLAKYPEARWHVHEPLPGNAAAGARLAFGRALESVYGFDAARVIVALDADFLGAGPGAVRYARDFTNRRKNPSAQTISRLYALECTPGLAGAMADERLALAPHEIERVAWRTGALLGIAPAGVFPDDPATARWERALAAALRTHRAESLIIAGPGLSAQTHALVHRMNAALGNAGTSVRYVEPIAVVAEPGDASLASLAAAMHEGRVDTLVMLGGNPLFDAPADLDFAKALERVAFSVHAGLYRNESARSSTWHLPQPHGYEQWGDALAFDGTATILQPVMRPLYATRSSSQLVANLMREADVAPLDRVKATWRAHLQDGKSEADFDAVWRDSLRRGVVEGTARAPVSANASGALTPPPLSSAPLVAVFASDPAIVESDFANNGWLHELPRPLTKLTWDNALLLSPATAHALALSPGDVVRATVSGRALEAPVWILPGHADGAVTLPLGYGRRAAGGVGNGVGFDAGAVSSAAALSGGASIVLEKTGARHAFATTQSHSVMEGRDPVRHAALDDYLAHPDFTHDEKSERVPEESLYPPYEYPDYKWGMAIDLNACIGCSACTIACQAENNIAVVGKAQVALGREMHWIRVDRYYEGPTKHQRTLFQPVPCMHCENAPCEEVCPVGATVHDSEGLNVQVYNRCVGTRFCSQNCPYKVRRFNFFQFSDAHDPGLKAVRNPQVTVRSRGVMEKCTYCVQRITRGRIEAEKEGRRLGDGEVVTACQAVCPTRAITFGNLNDAASAVNAAKASPLNYTLLAELNTRPRTTYLARITNPDRETGEG